LVQIELVVLKILSGRGGAELGPKRADRQPYRRRIAAGRPKQVGIGMCWWKGQHDANLSRGKVSRVETVYQVVKITNLKRTHLLSGFTRGPVRLFT